MKDHLPDLFAGNLPALPFDATGLTAHVTPEQALAALPRLGRLSGSLRWVHGDLVLAVIEGDTSRLHEAWQRIEGLDLDDRPSLMRSVAVAMAIPHQRRRPGLSWSHHRAVAGLDPDEQDRRLEEAETARWTVAALERAIADDLADDDDEPLFPPPPKPWTKAHAAVLARVDEAFAADPTCAVVLRADGTVRILAEPA